LTQTTLEIIKGETADIGIKEDRGGSSEKQGLSGNLKFTGNWFIDAGILGFVNLMEEVYGWDLEELQEMISKEPEKIYYGFFPIAFVYGNCKLTNEKLEPPLYEELNNKFRNLSGEKIFDKAWKYIVDNYSTNGRVNLHSKGLFYYFCNFLFFQPRWKEKQQKETFQEILALTELKREVLKHMDKTVNKFLPSADEFSNLPYTKSFVEISTLKKAIPNSNFVFLLTFPMAFIPVRSEKDNMFFYSPNTELTYKVNKKLKIMEERLTKDEKSQNNILRLTWNAVLDSIIETKSIWSIENMYLVTYKLGRNQSIFDVEYIGIPKLQASIILDDTIRKAMNWNIQYRSKKFKGNKFCWVIEEFIKGKPLYPVILNHVNVVLNDNINLSLYPSLYSLILDANILQFRAKKEKESKGLFSKSYFDNYRALNKEIKDDLRHTSYKASLIKGIANDDTKKRIARDLVEALKARDKNIFLNILLRNLNENIDLFDANALEDWIFEKIITNDLSFERYGLILAMNLLRGGKNEQ